MNITPLEGINKVKPVESTIVNPVNVEFNNSIQANLTYPSDEAFLRDVVLAFQGFGFNVNSLINFDNSNFLGFANVAINQSLTAFVRSLQASLNLTQAQETQTNNGNSVSNNNQTSTTQEPGFSNFINDLLFLISNNNSNNQFGLQSNFNNLINLLLPNSPGVSQSPTIDTFLAMMLANLQNGINNQNQIGTSIHTLI